MKKEALGILRFPPKVVLDDGRFGLFSFITRFNYLTPDLTTMPEEAELGIPPPEAQYKSWDGTRVPPSVFDVLTEKYRGQKGIGTKQVEVLDFFTETARLKGVGQTTMSGGGGGSPPPTLTREKNVETVFKLKAAPYSSTSTLVAAYGQINASRMMKHVLLSSLRN